MTLTMRDYVLVAELPNGEPVFLRYTTTEVGYSMYARAIEERILTELGERYPEARPVKAGHKDGTGGSGWSQPYDVGVKR